MKRNIVLSLLLVLLVIMCAACTSSPTNAPNAAPSAPNSPSVPNNDGTSNTEKAVLQPDIEQLKVHFLDVGQADSILLQVPGGKNILVDAGNNDDGSLVTGYLNQLGIKKIDFLVGTHPHEDHIGGMDNVIKAFEIGKVFMPNKTNTTKTYEDVLLALKAKNLKITNAKAGVSLLEQDNIKINFIAPNKTKYEDLNNWSAVLHVQYGDTAFLLTGDAEQLSEKEMLAAGANLKADVLKIGHHGSSSSTSQKFFNAVIPKYAVISVGKDNDYGHPHKETLTKLSKAEIKLYRTDLNGTVVFTSDGKNINVN